MRKLFANLLIIVVGVAAFAFAKPIGSEIVKFFTSSPAITDADVETMIAESPLRSMYEALKIYFPDEAEHIRSSMLTVLRGKPSRVEAFSKMFVVGSEIRKRHAAKLRTAPDQLLVAVLQSQTEMIAAFDDNVVLCNQVLMNGPGAIPRDERHRVLHLMESAGLLYQAMYEGEQSPVQRAQISDDDWANLVADFYTADGTDVELGLVIEPEIENPQLCGAMLRFLRVLAEAKFPGADRLRAETVAAINES